MPPPSPAVRLAPLATAEPAAVEALLDAAFGPDRHSRTAYRLREGATPIAVLSFAAWAEDVLVGVLQSWPVVIEATPLVLVGPVAVRPELQGSGIGSALMAALSTAAGATPMVMVGDADYYGRWGFDAEGTAGWRLPGPWDPHRLLARGTEALPAEGMLAPALAAGPVAA